MIGLVDPSHSEREADTWGRLPRWMTVQEMAQALLQSDPKYSPWTYELFAAVMSEHQERDYISTSFLTGGCMRGNVVERREDYIDRLDNYYAAIKGTLIHRTLEYQSRPDSFAEHRFWTEIAGVEVSCSPDLITLLPQPAMWDYKTTENPPTFDYPYRHHTEQVQLNRFIVNNASRWDPPIAGVEHPQFWEFKQCIVVYIGPKAPKVIVNTKSVDWRTPNNKLIKRKMPYVWSDKEVLAEFEPRVEWAQKALDAYPEWPEGLEEVTGWAGPPSWTCPGPPVCHLPNCIARRGMLVWDRPA